MFWVLLIIGLGFILLTKRSDVQTTVDKNTAVNIDKLASYGLAGSQTVGTVTSIDQDSNIDSASDTPDTFNSGTSGSDTFTWEQERSIRDRKDNKWLDMIREIFEGRRGEKFYPQK